MLRYGKFFGIKIKGLCFYCHKWVWKWNVEEYWNTQAMKYGIPVGLCNECKREGRHEKERERHREIGYE